MWHPRFFISVCLWAGIAFHTQAATHPIDTCGELLAIPFESKHTYTLQQDIDCKGFEVSHPRRFSGTLDGKGFTVHHLHLIAQGTESGLFSVLLGATIQHITFADTTVTLCQAALCKQGRANCRCDCGVSYNALLAHVTVTHTKVRHDMTALPRLILARW